MGVLITDLLTSLVGLHPTREGHIPKSPSTFPMFFHHSLNPKMFDELFCWAMHVFDMLWDDQGKKSKRVEVVMAMLKEKLSQKLKQPPVHGGFEMLFQNENRVLKVRMAKRNALQTQKETLLALYPELVARLCEPDMYIVMAINKVTNSLSRSSLLIFSILSFPGNKIFTLFDFVH